jgi:hypothetical protein
MHDQRVSARAASQLIISGYDQRSSERSAYRVQTIDIENWCAPYRRINFRIQSQKSGHPPDRMWCSGRKHASQPFGRGFESLVAQYERHQRHILVLLLYALISLVNGPPL